jgi:hypothetical protein
MIARDCEAFLAQANQSLRPSTLHISYFFVITSMEAIPAFLSPALELAKPNYRNSMENNLTNLNFK